MRLIAAFVSLGALGLLAACGVGDDATFRYRLSFSLGINGAVRSGSSIIAVRYWTGGASWGTGKTTYSIVKGVAPVIDLGRYGTLVASMASNGEEWFRRKKQYGLTCKKPLTADSLPAKFSQEPAALANLRQGKRDLTDDSYPAFIWFPYGQPYERAQQLCPEEFPRVIGANIELQSVTIEVAPDAPLLTRLNISVPWLDEIRADQTRLGGVTTTAGIFKPRRTLMIETDDPTN
ncbi:hypothetical protein CO669_08360 [Bradyrhizobium sp. Y36]|uniref:hypothetical protein n=1 Tax=Bradyrhizobium sp. Y36 TaxID=2035447 RepID=UPI000BE98FFE|nr:hypothetical protein [Bradyrhizobium sp. Y36]PDT91078.1 hypothetical protein CO669_08360 [Bradyrhizobium sp. Y36]